ncbi:MAG TPA: hypothetical protein VMI12_13595 [Puia sp.]|nr:hypothetical protein [Puia sp.]
METSIPNNRYMPKEEKKDLIKFLKPFDKDIREIALWLREFIWDQYPDSNELIYDNYNAVAVGWSPTDKVGDTFCSIAVGTNKHVHFGFYWGSRIADPEKMLLGNGNQYRYITVKDKREFPKTYIKKLMKEAHAYSLGKMKEKKQVLKGSTIVKSISPVKRRPK